MTPKEVRDIYLRRISNDQEAERRNLDTVFQGRKEEIGNTQIEEGSSSPRNCHSLQQDEEMNVLVVEELLWEENEDGDLIHIDTENLIVAQISEITFTTGTYWAHSIHCSALKMGDDLWQGISDDIETAKRRASVDIMSAICNVLDTKMPIRKATWEKEYL